MRGSRILKIGTIVNEHSMSWDAWPFVKTLIEFYLILCGAFMVVGLILRHIFKKGI